MSYAIRHAISDLQKSCRCSTCATTNQHYQVGRLDQMGSVCVKRLITLPVLGAQRVRTCRTAVNWTKRRYSRIALADRDLSQPKPYRFALDLIHGASSCGPAILLGCTDQALQHHRHDLLVQHESTIPRKPRRYRPRRRAATPMCT